MNALIRAIADRMKNDPILAAQLSSYNGEPAVFTVEPVPGDAQLPFICSPANVADVDWDSRTSFGREISRDVKCYTVFTGSEVQVEEMSARVRKLFHRQRVIVDGFHFISCRVTGPIAAPTDGTVSGRILTLHMILEEL